jgi:hypothetical protein
MSPLGTDVPGQRTEAFLPLTDVAAARRGPVSLAPSPASPALAARGESRPDMHTRAHLTCDGAASRGASFYSRPSGRVGPADVERPV